MGQGTRILNEDGTLAINAEDQANFLAQAREDARLQAQKELTGKTIEGDDGLLRVEGGVNRFGFERPDQILQRDASGQLDERFRESLGPSLARLQQETLTVGVSSFAKAARASQAAENAKAVDAVNRQSAQQLANQTSALALRGGLSSGARERLASQNQRTTLANLQRQAGQNNLANLRITQNDEQQRQNNLFNLGRVEQTIGANNINRLSRDLQQQNQRNLDVFKEDQALEASSRVANAQRAAGGGGCFVGGTPVKTFDGGMRNIEDIDLGDELEHGGMVTTIVEVMSDDIYTYMGVQVTGTHAVKEDGKWIRVADSDLARKQQGMVSRVYCLGTVNHRIIAGGIEFADYYEVDGGDQLTNDEALKRLNAE